MQSAQNTDNAYGDCGVGGRWRPAPCATWRGVVPILWSGSSFCFGGCTGCDQGRLSWCKGLRAGDLFKTAAISKKCAGNHFHFPFSAQIGQDFAVSRRFEPMREDLTECVLCLRGGDGGRRIVFLCVGMRQKSARISWSHVCVSKGQSSCVWRENSF